MMSPVGFTAAPAAKLPMNRMISVISRVRNTPNTAMLTWVLRISMYVLKMANPSRIQPTSWLTVVTAAATATGVLAPVMAGTATSWYQMPRPIQKPPYVENATAPNTFLLRNSHMPASNWASPP